MGLHGCCRQNMNNFFKSKFLWITWLLSQNYPHLCSLTKAINKVQKKPMGSYELKRPALKSSTACINSSLVFITKGPY
jgi:hypothetical protein